MSKGHLCCKGRIAVASCPSLPHLISVQMCDVVGRRVHRGSQPVQMRHSHDRPGQCHEGMCQKSMPVRRLSLGAFPLAVLPRAKACRDYAVADHTMLDKHQCQRYIEVIRIREKDRGIREIEPGQRMMSTSAFSDLLTL